MTAPASDAYYDVIAARESGGVTPTFGLTSQARYEIVNTLDYLGKYQMGDAALVEAGFYMGSVSGDGVQVWDDTKWTALARSFGVSSRAGFLSHPASPMRAFVKTREGLDSPDAMLAIQPMLVTPEVKIAKEAGITIIAHQMRPESKGSIHIKTADASQPPAIRFNFLSESIDRECLLAAMRVTRRLMEAPVLKWIEPEEFGPGPQAQSDDELLDYVTRTAETTYHPVGTCKMGSDPMAVVDDQLRVRGIVGLRVADASIMPTLTSGNTNAPSIMIGEKCARMVLAAAEQKAAA